METNRNKKKIESQYLGKGAWKWNLCLPVQTYTMQSIKFLHIAYFIF